MRDAILIGLVLAAIILVLFLRDWGSSIVAGLVIPATIAITFIVLRLLGESFDLMTLGGLAAAVGLVIDDAIVVVENIVLHRDSGQSRGEAIRSALREIRVPLVGSTVTPIVVFLPLITITGVTGTFFRALAITVGTALLTSLPGAHMDPHAEPFSAAPPALRHAAGFHRCHGQSRHGFHGPRNALLWPSSELALALALGSPQAAPALVVGLLLLLQRPRQRSASRNGRRRFRSRLPHARRIVSCTTPTTCSPASKRFSQRHPKSRVTSRRTGLQLGLAAVTEANTGDFLVQAQARSANAASTRLSRSFAKRLTTNTRSSISNSPRSCRT